MSPIVYWNANVASSSQHMQGCFFFLTYMFLLESFTLLTFFLASLATMMLKRELTCIRVLLRCKFCNVSVCGWDSSFISVGHMWGYKALHSLPLWWDAWWAQSCLLSDFDGMVEIPLHSTITQHTASQSISLLLLEMFFLSYQIPYPQ